MSLENIKLDIQDNKNKLQIISKFISGLEEDKAKFLLSQGDFQQMLYKNLLTNKNEKDFLNLLNVLNNVGISTNNLFELIKKIMLEDKQSADSKSKIMLLNLFSEKLNKNLLKLIKKLELFKSNNEVLKNFIEYNSEKKEINFNSYIKVLNSKTKDNINLNEIFDIFTNFPNENLFVETFKVLNEKGFILTKLFFEYANYLKNNKVDGEKSKNLLYLYINCYVIKNSSLLNASYSNYSSDATNATITADSFEKDSRTFSLINNSTENIATKTLFPIIDIASKVIPEALSLRNRFRGNIRDKNVSKMYEYILSNENFDINVKKLSKEEETLKSHIKINQITDKIEFREFLEVLSKQKQSEINLNEIFDIITENQDKTLVVQTFKILNEKGFVLTKIFFEYVNYLEKNKIDKDESINLMYSFIDCYIVRNIELLKTINSKTNIANDLFNSVGSLASGAARAAISGGVSAIPDIAAGIISGAISTRNRFRGKIRDKNVLAMYQFVSIIEENRNNEKKNIEVNKAIKNILSSSKVSDLSKYNILLKYSGKNNYDEIAEYLKNIKNFDKFVKDLTKYVISSKIITFAEYAKKLEIFKEIIEIDDSNISNNSRNLEKVNNLNGILNKEIDNISNKNVEIIQTRNYNNEQTKEIRKQENKNDINSLNDKKEQKYEYDASKVSENALSYYLKHTIKTSGYEKLNFEEKENFLFNIISNQYINKEVFDLVIDILKVANKKVSDEFIERFVNNKQIPLFFSYVNKNEFDNFRKSQNFQRVVEKTKSESSFSSILDGFLKLEKKIDKKNLKPNDVYFLKNMSDMGHNILMSSNKPIQKENVLKYIDNENQIKKIVKIKTNDKNISDIISTYLNNPVAEIPSNLFLEILNLKNKDKIMEKIAGNKSSLEFFTYLLENNQSVLNEDSFVSFLNNIKRPEIMNNIVSSLMRGQKIFGFGKSAFDKISSQEIKEKILKAILDNGATTTSYTLSNILMHSKNDETREIALNTILFNYNQSPEPYAIETLVSIFRNPVKYNLEYRNKLMKLLGNSEIAFGHFLKLLTNDEVLKFFANENYMNSLLSSNNCIIVNDILQKVSSKWSFFNRSTIINKLSDENKNNLFNKLAKGGTFGSVESLNMFVNLLKKDDKNYKNIILSISKNQKTSQKVVNYINKNLLTLKEVSVEQAKNNDTFDKNENEVLNIQQNVSLNLLPTIELKDSVIGKPLTVEEVDKIHNSQVTSKDDKNDKYFIIARYSRLNSEIFDKLISITSSKARIPLLYNAIENKYLNEKTIEHINNEAKKTDDKELKIIAQTLLDKTKFKLNDEQNKTYVERLELERANSVSNKITSLFRN